MGKAREISKEYLNEFIELIKSGSRVLYVEESGDLAVEHPTKQYLVLEIKDKVIDNETS
jgi:type IV secretory pathway ATPase VirB11/archaellum biosynthesis ATPase